MLQSDIINDIFLYTAVTRAYDSLRLIQHQVKLFIVGLFNKFSVQIDLISLVKSGSKIGLLLGSVSPDKCHLAFLDQPVRLAA